MAQREIQSVEVSCFVHATEDQGKVVGAIASLLGIDSLADTEALEGHYRNSIVHVTWHLTGEEAWRVFRRLAVVMGEDGRSQVLTDLDSHTDEHGSLYMRFSKQSLVRGAPLFSSSDPVRIRVKPRGFMMKSGPREFYGRLLEQVAV